MKVGLVSDSFGNLGALSRALDTLVAVGAEKIFFLGGRYGDVDRVLDARRAGGAPPADGDAGDSLGFLKAVEGALASAPSKTERAEADRLAGDIVRVASKGCPEYHREDSPKKVLEMVEGMICCLVHDKGELDRDDISNAAVLIHGNSSAAAMVQIGPRFFITPGHLRSPPPAPDKPPTFALLDLSPTGIVFTVFGLDGKPRRTDRSTLGGRSKVSVK